MAGGAIVHNKGTKQFSPDFRGSKAQILQRMLYSIGSKPLELWGVTTRHGHVKRVTDNDIQSLVVEVKGNNVSTTYITCPADPRRSMGITLPYLVLIVKNLKDYFSFEVTVLDDGNNRRRFRASNYHSRMSNTPMVCTMPMELDEGWNQIQFDLRDYTLKAYGTGFVEAQRIQIHANCRVRRVYFSDRMYAPEELPNDYKLYMPIKNNRQRRLLLDGAQRQHVEPIGGGGGGGTQGSKGQAAEDGEGLHELPLGEEEEGEGEGHGPSTVTSTPGEEEEEEEDTSGMEAGDEPDSDQEENENDDASVEDS